MRTIRTILSAALNGERVSADERLRVVLLLSIIETGPAESRLAIYQKLRSEAISPTYIGFERAGDRIPHAV